MYSKYLEKNKIEREEAYLKRVVVGRHRVGRGAGCLRVAEEGKIKKEQNKEEEKI